MGIIYDFNTIECGECGSRRYETFSTWDGHHGIRCLVCGHESGVEFWHKNTSSAYPIYTTTAQSVRKF